MLRMRSTQICIQIYKYPCAHMYMCVWVCVCMSFSHLSPLQCLFSKSMGVARIVSAAIGVATSTLQIVFNLCTLCRKIIMLTSLCRYIYRIMHICVSNLLPCPWFPLTSHSRQRANANISRKRPIPEAKRFDG